MQSRIISMETLVVGSDDGMETYEVRRTWNADGKKALVIELYPTISIEHPMILDASTMHLLNHSEELGWGLVRIINLYPTVFDSKPLVADLSESVVNMEYIKDIFDEQDIEDYDIVIAFGNGLSNHACTQHIKEKLIKLLREKGVSGQVKHIVTDTLDTKKMIGTHPLFLGLRQNRERWYLEKYPMQDVQVDAVEPMTENHAVTKKKQEKAGRKKNVSEAKESC